jgi:hypothetical protein
LAEAASVINGANAISNLTRLPRVSASTEMNLRAQPKALLSPAVQAVKRLHSELGCEILENKQAAQRVAGQMLDVETVIKMLDRGIFSFVFEEKGLAVAERIRHCVYENVS